MKSNFLPITVFQPPGGMHSQSVFYCCYATIILATCVQSLNDQALTNTGNLQQAFPRCQHSSLEMSVSESTSPECRQSPDRPAHDRADIRSVAAGAYCAGSQAAAPSVSSGQLGRISAVAPAPSNCSVISPAQSVHCNRLHPNTGHTTQH